MSGSSNSCDLSQPSLIDPAHTEAHGPNTVSRRTSLAGLAGLAVPALAGQMRPIEVGRTYAARGRSLSSLTSVLGVNAVTSTLSGPYGQQSVMLKAMKDLGVSWIRSRIHTGNKMQVAWINQLAANGIKTNGLIDLPGKRDTPEMLVSLVASSMPGAMLSMEGPNEWNLQGGSNWVSELVAYQTRLWNAVKANPVTRNLQVVAPALGMRTGYTEFGNRSSIMDWGNIHLYTGGYVPGYRTDDVLAQERIVCGSKPVIVTETGWHNAEAWHGPHYYTPEDVAGLYAPRLLLEYFIRNVPRLAIYELVDNPAGGNLREQHFGLLRGDLSRKPAFNSLANMYAILTRGARTTGRASAPLSFSFRGAPTDLRSALVDCGGGRLMLFLWRSQASIYDPQTRRRLTPAPATATIAWGTTQRIKRYAPASSSNALSSDLTSVSNVTLGAELQMLEITAS